MEKVIQLILTKINKKPTDIAKAKHGNSPEILYYNLIYGIIKFNSALETREFLGIAEQTFNRILKRCFPGVVLKGGGQTWSYYLLASVDYRKCHSCNEIKPVVQMLPNGSCKYCRHLYNTSSERRSKNRLAQQEFYHNNKEYYRQKKAKYRAIKIKACPIWADLEAIKHFYYSCPEGHHVDHIVPLQGKYVCGLHVPWNLQYLPAKENCSKSNYHESEEYWK
jgi:hypothetical protein